MQNSYTLITILVLLFVTFTALYCQTRSEVPSGLLKVSANLGFVNGASVGILVSRIPESGLEQYLNLDFMHAPYYTTYGGINVKVKNSRRFYYIWTAGFDYGKIISFSFDPGGSDPDEEDYQTLFLPHITFGLGYNIARWERGSAFVEWDIGIKAGITNINLGVNF